RRVLFRSRSWWAAWPRNCRFSEPMAPPGGLRGPPGGMWVAPVVRRRRPEYRQSASMNLNLTLIAQALAFAALIWLIASKIWPPLLAAIEERQKKIAEGLAAADHAQKNLAQAEEQVAGELK